MHDPTDALNQFQPNRRFWLKMHEKGGLWATGSIFRDSRRKNDHHVVVPGDAGLRCGDRTAHSLADISVDGLIGMRSRVFPAHHDRVENIGIQPSAPVRHREDLHPQRPVQVRVQSRVIADAPHHLCAEVSWSVAYRCACYTSWCDGNCGSLARSSPNRHREFRIHLVVSTQ